MSTYLETIVKKVVKIPSYGKCLLLAIKKCLEVDFDIKRMRKILQARYGRNLKIH